MAERFIQVGMTAARDPKTGDFLPAVPLYAREADMGREAAEEFRGDIARLLAEKMKEYKDGCDAAGVAAW